MHKRSSSVYLVLLFCVADRCISCSGVLDRSFVIESEELGVVVAQAPGDVDLAASSDIDKLSVSRRRIENACKVFSYR